MTAPEIELDVRRSSPRLLKPMAHSRKFGQCEGDLTPLKQRPGQINVTSLVERSSRFPILLKSPNKGTRPVIGEIMKAMQELRHLAANPSALARGSEFVSQPRLQAKIGKQYWFCEPSFPRQKGTATTPIDKPEDGCLTSDVSDRLQTRYESDLWSPEYTPCEGLGVRHLLKCGAKCNWRKWTTVPTLKARNNRDSSIVHTTRLSKELRRL